MTSVKELSDLLTNDIQELVQLDLCVSYSMPMFDVEGNERKLDLSSTSFYDLLAQAIVSKFGGLDLAVNLQCQAKEPIDPDAAIDAAHSLTYQIHTINISQDSKSHEFTFKIQFTEHWKCFYGSCEHDSEQDVEITSPSCAFTLKGHNFECMEIMHSIITHLAE